MPLFLLLPLFTRRLDSLLSGGAKRARKRFFVCLFVCLFVFFVLFCFVLFFFSRPVPYLSMVYSGSFRKQTVSGSSKSIPRNWSWRLTEIILVSGEFIK